MRTRTKEDFSQYHEIFKDHKISFQSQDRIVLQKKYKETWDTAFAVDIVLISSGLLVHGDIDPVIFKYMNSYNVLNAISWLGGKEYTSYIYEKAKLGMRPSFNLSHSRVALCHAAIHRAWLEI